MNRSHARTEARAKVRRRIRQTVRGHEARPRLAVFKSARHIYAQIIDDGSGSTLAHASSLDPGLRQAGKKSAVSKDSAGKVGGLVAERAKKAGVTKVVFDRGGYRYHGRVKALADAARQGGLEF
jgi:large subunit ribosomal protein L18